MPLHVTTALIKVQPNGQEEGERRERGRARGAGTARVVRPLVARSRVETPSGGPGLSAGWRVGSPGGGSHQSPTSRSPHLFTPPFRSSATASHPPSTST